MSKVRAAGFRLTHPLDVVVTVSARTQGRAKGGMADCISAWAREEVKGAPVLVECPVVVETRLHRRAALRNSGTAPGGAGMADAALIEQTAADDPDAPATVPALEAIAALSERIAFLRGISDAA